MEGNPGLMNLFDRRFDAIEDRIEFFLALDPRDFKALVGEAVVGEKMEV